MNRGSFKQMFAQIVIGVSIAVLSCPALADDWSKRYPIREDVPGPYSYEAISQKDYRGVTLRVLTHEMPVIGEPTALHAKQFEELTGATVIVEHVPFGDLYQKLLFGLKKGTYDVAFYASLWIADMYEYLEPVPQKMIDSPQFQDVLQHYKEIAMWGDTCYHVPIDGDRHYLQYRQDAISDSAVQEEFQTTYSRPLAAPKTWKEFREVAEFFQNTQAEKVQPLFGAVEITKKDDLMFSQFIKRAAAYAKHPDVKGGFYFDLETMTPLINTPGFVAALEDFVAMQAFYPPGGTNWGLADVIQSFGKGEAVLSDCWDDPFIQAMQTESGIRNTVAAALSPGSTTVWNRKTQQWDEFPDVNYAPYIAWGWTSAVSKTSKQKEAAFDFLGFFANEANHASDLLVGRYGVNPFRQADLQKEFWMTYAGWNDAVASSYVETLSKMNANRNRVYDLRIYQGRLYMKALETGVSRALTKRSTPQAALDFVAQEWKQLNQTIGIEKQRSAYAHIVKFEDGE